MMLVARVNAGWAYWKANQLDRSCQTLGGFLDYTTRTPARLERRLALATPPLLAAFLSHPFLPSRDQIEVATTRTDTLPFPSSPWELGSAVTRGYLPCARSVFPRRLKCIR